jgi:NAD(P)-dependent dehydrogenase (short-subunit alcohol dehydrogenase family)
MKELRGRTAFVTGAASGIGRGIARACAAEGMNVAVADIDGAGAREVSAELAAKGAQAIAVPADVTSSESLAAAAKETAARFGGVNLLCNNAGVMLPLGPLEEKSDADWEYVFSVNVFGVVKGVQAFLPLLRAAGPGNAHIVNTASLGGLVAVPGFPIGVYVASKYACVGYSESLRGELEPEGIGVSVLCPGMTASNLTTTSARHRPQRFGGADPLPAQGSAPKELEATFMDPDRVGRAVIHGVRENRLHIFSHVDARPMVERRFAQIAADFEAAARTNE